MLEFIADYGKPSAPLPAAIVACVPRKAHMDGIGETEFQIEPEEILAAIEAGLKEPIEAEPEVYTLNILYVLVIVVIRDTSGSHHGFPPFTL